LTHLTSTFLRYSEANVWFTASVSLHLSEELSLLLLLLLLLLASAVVVLPLLLAFVSVGLLDSSLAGSAVLPE